MLAADIAERGLLAPITLLDGKVLDGRARLAACEQAGVAPVLVEHVEDGTPVEVWLVAANTATRDLSAGQRAAIAVEVEHTFVEDARARAVAGFSRGGQVAAARRRGQQVPQPARSPSGFVVDPLAGFTLAERARDAGGAPVRFSGKSRDQAAALLGVSTGYVAQAKVLWREAPELFRAVKAGSCSLKEALREHVEGERPSGRPRVVVEVADDAAAAALIAMLRRDERVLRADVMSAPEHASR